MPRLGEGRPQGRFEVQDRSNETESSKMDHTATIRGARKKQSLISAFFRNPDEEGVKREETEDQAEEVSETKGRGTVEREEWEPPMQTGRTTEMPPILFTYTKRQKKKQRDHRVDAETTDSPDSVLPAGKPDPKVHEETEVECKRTKVGAFNRPKRQLYLDLGQADFAFATCKVCGIMYAKGEENDEHTHDLYHKQFLQGIRFTGWKEERLLCKTEEGGRILLVLAGDHPHHLAKVKEVSEHLEKQLGLSPGWLLSVQVKAFLFVKDKKLIGSVVAENIEKSHQVLMATTDVSQDRRPSLQSIALSETNKSAICGFRVVWVHHEYRRMKVATRLLDAVRSHWMPACVIPRHLCAFSQVTEDGRALAQKYCGTSEFLVYK